MSQLSNLHIGREAVSGQIARLIQALVGFGGTIIFARYLNPTGYGGIVFFMTVGTLVDQPMNGWSMAVKKRVSEDIDRVDESVGTQLVFNTLWACILAVGAFAFGEHLTASTGIQYAPLLLVLYVLTGTTLDTFYKILQGIGKISLSYWVETARRSFSFLARVGLMFVFGGVGIIYASILVPGIIIPAVIYLAGVHPRFPNVNRLREYAEFGQYSIPAAIFGTVAKRIDILLLGFVLTSKSVGYYEIAWQLTLPGIFIAYAAGSGLMAKVSNIEHKNATGAIKNTVAFTSVLTIPILFGSPVIGRELVVTLFGAEYLPAVQLIVGLALYRVVRSQSDPLENTVYGLDRPDSVLKISVVTILANVLLGAVLIMKIGILGVVLATIVSEIVRYVAVIVVLRNELGTAMFLSRPLFDQLVAGGLMFAGVSAVRSILDVAPWLTIVVIVGSGTVFYAGALTLISPWHRDRATQYVSTA